MFAILTLPTLSCVCHSVQIDLSPGLSSPFFTISDYALVAAACWHKSIFALPSPQCCKPVPAPPRPLLVDSWLCLLTWTRSAPICSIPSPPPHHLVQKLALLPSFIRLFLALATHTVSPQYSAHAVCWGFLPRSCNHPFGGLVPSKGQPPCSLVSRLPLGRLWDI